jgi:ABC-2 type transport system permease protein
LLSGWYYWIIMAVLFFTEQFAQNQGMKQSPFEQFIKGLDWRAQYFHGFSYGQMWYFIIALILGAGCIANDNKANALLAYLSKPCTKLDYVVGKWVGIFLPLVATMVLPMLVFYIFGALSWRSYGFLSNDPWVLLKYFIMAPIAAAFQASLIVAVSSLFRQGQQAGAAYAAFYFVANFFTIIMTVAFTSAAITNSHQKPLFDIAPLTFASIDGVQIGLAKAILGPIKQMPFGVPISPRLPIVPAPNLWIMILVIVVISSLAAFLTWKRIQAVEVVR